MRLVKKILPFLVTSKEAMFTHRHLQRELPCHPYGRAFCKRYCSSYVNVYQSHRNTSVTMWP